MKWVLMACALSLTACVSTETGTKFDVQAARNIRAKVTTKADVIQLVGTPQSRYNVGKVENWTYAYSSMKANATAIAFIPYAGPFLPGGIVATGRDDSMVIGFAGDRVSSCVVTTVKSSGSGSSINQTSTSNSQTVDCHALE